MKASVVGMCTPGSSSSCTHPTLRDAGSRCGPGNCSGSRQDQAGTTKPSYGLNGPKEHRPVATEKGSEIRQALLQIAGVHSVGAMSLDDVCVLAHVIVGYDPALTNPIVIRDELG